jgi:hypothetical protein
MGQRAASLMSVGANILCRIAFSINPRRLFTGTRAFHPPEMTRETQGDTFQRLSKKIVHGGFFLIHNHSRRPGAVVPADH